jgi:hypothetical protein
MDWLSKYGRVIQYTKKAVRLTKKDGTTVKFVAAMQVDQASMLSQMKVTALEEILVVQEYLDVFPEELLGMPPDRDIEFLIELLPETPPISKRPYRMPINELLELKKQLAELQAKGYSYILAHRPREHQCYLWRRTIRLLVQLKNVVSHEGNPLSITPFLCT